MLRKAAVVYAVNGLFAKAGGPCATAREVNALLRSAQVAGGRTGRRAARRDAAMLGQSPHRGTDPLTAS